MEKYSYIEERYCLAQKRNIGVECRCHDDGRTEYYCLSKEFCPYCQEGICAIKGI